MSEAKKKLLVVYEQGAPLPLSELLPSGFDSQSCQGWERGLEAALYETYDVIVVTFPLADAPFQGFIDTIRSIDSPSSECGLVVVTTPGSKNDAVEFLGKGVNRVVAMEDRGALMGAIAEVIDVSPRASARLLVQMQMSVGEKEGRIMTFTENISRSGMLLGTSTKLNIGQQLDFQLGLVDDGKAVKGKAEVVRHTIQDREGKSGIGIRFLGFEGDGEDVLVGFLDRVLSIDLTNESNDVDDW